MMRVNLKISCILYHFCFYINEEEDREKLLEPYDPSNMYNIFTNQLKLRTKPQTPFTDKKVGEQSVDKATLEFFKNLRLSINKMHLRFEDDVLQGCDKPFCFGITISVSINIINGLEFYL